MSDTIVVKCYNEKAHNHTSKEKGEGNVLCFIRGNSIYIKCTDNSCKQFTRIQFSKPGVYINLARAAITQKSMPKGCRFQADKATTVIEVQ